MAVAGSTCIQKNKNTGRYFLRIRVWSGSLFLSVNKILITYIGNMFFMTNVL